MSLRSISFALGSLAVGVSLVLGCGGGAPRSDEPTTAKEKQRREADATGETFAGGGGKAAGWRYTGDRNDCFFVVGRRCFKTEAAACAAAKCGKKKCDVTGGGPASVSCAK